MHLQSNRVLQGTGKLLRHPRRILQGIKELLQQSKMFRRFLMSYLIILIIPSFAGYLSYRTSISVTESMSIENSLTELNKSKEMLERRMAEVEGFTRQLALNQDLNVLLNERPGADGAVNVYGIWKLINQVTPFSQTNDFLQNYYIYLNNYDVILAKGSSYKPEAYFETNHYEHMALNEWKDEVLHATHRSDVSPLNTMVTDDKRRYSAVSYMQSLPLDSSSGTSPAMVVVNIDEKNIQNLLSGWIERYGGWTSVMDEKGRPISLQGISSDKMKAISSGLEAESANGGGRTSQFREGDLIITIHSKTTGWVYRAGIPKVMLMENANRIKHISWLFTGAALLIGLLAGFFLSYRNSVPLNRLLTMIKEQAQKEETSSGGKRNEYDFLHGNISQMISENKHLETEVARQFPLVRDGFLKRLISGEFKTKSEILAAAAQSKIELESQSGYVGILHITGYPDLDSVDILNELYAARLLVKQMLLTSLPSLYMTDLGSDRIVLICFNTEEQSRDGQQGENSENGEDGREQQQLVLEKPAAEVKAKAYELYKMKLNAAFGGYFSSIQDIGQSFEQAKQTAESLNAEGEERVAWFSESRLDSASYYYPLDVEQRLISTVRAGEGEEADKLLHSIFMQNNKNRSLVSDMKFQFINEMKGTFIKLLDQKVFQESDRHQELYLKTLGIHPGAEWETLQQEFGGILATMCTLVTSKQNDNQIQTVEKIKVYIAQNYSDGDLNLYRIAEHAERPEKYISQLFKEITGVNLSDYLEQVRLDEAVKLLRENRYTVDEISEKVGYNSSHSFRRAFKRVMGVSPSAYKQLAH